MYHLYKAFAESEADILKTQQAYASEEHGVTVPYSCATATDGGATVGNFSLQRVTHLC